MTPTDAISEMRSKGTAWRRHGKRALLLLSAILLTECVARLALRTHFVLSRGIACESEAAWRAWWLRHQTRANPMCTPMFVHSPTLGWEPRPGLQNAPGGHHWTVSTDAHGIRGLREYPIERTPDRHRILVLGDSYTFGIDVNDHETYAARLEQGLERTDVINLGVGGYGNDQMLLRFIESGIRYRPDVVLIGFASCDMTRNTIAFRDYGKPRFHATSGGLELRGVPVAAPELMAQRARWRSHALDLASVVRDAAAFRSGARGRESEAMTVALLKETFRVIRSAGAEPVLVYLSIDAELAQLDNDAPTEAETIVAGFCEGMRVACILTRPAFVAAARRGEVFKRQGHWDAQGHAIIANAIQQYLVTNGWPAATPPP